MRSQQKKTAAFESLQICRKFYPWRVFDWEDINRFTLDRSLSVRGLHRKVLPDGDPSGAINSFDGKTYETDLPLESGYVCRWLNCT